MERQVTMRIGGVGLIADVDYYSHDEWMITEVYPDMTEDWPYENGLWDLFSKWTQDKIELEVFHAMAEPPNAGEDE